MNQIVESLKSPEWWISVVVVGIAINLASAYLKPRLDTFLGRLSRTVQERNEKSRKRRQDLLDLLRADPQKQIVFSTYEMRCRIGASTFLLLAFMITVAGGVFCYVTALYFLAIPLWLFVAFTLMAAMYDIFAATKACAIISEIHPDVSK